MRDCPNCGIEPDRDCEMCEGGGIVPSVVSGCSWIERAYAAYDGDARVNGHEDFAAFQDAIVRQWERRKEASHA